MKKIIYFLCVGLLISCGGKKKQALDEADIQKKAELNAIFETEEVLDTIAPASGVKYKGTRNIDPANPPVIIDLVSPKEAKDLDLANYYSKAKFIKLKHPLDPADGGFLGNADVKISADKWMQTMGGVNSRVYFTDNHIIAGDSYFGYHCYSKDGNFSHTIVAMEKLPVYNAKGNTVTIEWNDSVQLVRTFSAMGDNCLFLIAQGRKGKLFFHNITSRKNYLERPPAYGNLHLLNPTTILSYRYGVLDEERNNYLDILDYKGDTISTFLNYNQLVQKGKGSYTNPDSPFIYYLDNKPSIRQAYNDTVYRIISEQKLQPAYVMNFGKQKLDIQTGLYGNKAGKLIPYTWLEAKDFIFITYTENYDCPNNRNNGSVKFFYTYYDKKSGNLYQLPANGFPEDQLINNSIDGAIPVVGNIAKTDNKSLSIAYTKAQLGKIINGKNFKSLPQQQQDNLQQQFDNLSDQEMLIMILE